MRRFLVCALGALVSGGPLLASGYLIYEQGAKASAQAGAFTARADDASAIFYNPAGITALEDWQIVFGSSVLFLGETQFRSPTLGDDEMVRNKAYPTHLYLTNRASERISWGIGAYTPFGLETEWDDQSPLRFSSQHAEVRAIYLTGVLGIRISDSFSVAAGLTYVTGEVRAFSRFINLDSLAPITTPPTLGQEAFTNLRGDDTDYTYTLGLQYRNPDGIHLGLSYRGRARLELDGSVTFEGVPDALIGLQPPLQPLSAKFVDGPGSSVLPLPAGAVFAVGWVGDAWSFEFDAVWTEWSSFGELPLQFENQSSFGPIPIVADQVVPENWHNTMSWRVGVGYAFNDRHEIRWGLYADQNPIPDTSVRPSLPDADRQSAQVGYGYTMPGGLFGVDAYYQYIRFAGRDVPEVPADDSVIAGSYATRISILGASLRFKF
ncbi:MAG: outer membrane protein transport protein [Acidobacteriota bacterium]|jgi:long-chain fatty acid transport protein